MRRDHSTVPSFPRISAEILDEVTARVTVSGIVSSVTGTDLNATRAEVIRLISLTAKRLGRPVRALTVEGGEEWPLVIYPDGVVESDTTVDPGKRKGKKKQTGRGSKAKGGTAPRTPEAGPVPSGPPSADAFVSGAAPDTAAVAPERTPAPEEREDTGGEPVRPSSGAPSLFEMVVQSLEERDRTLAAEQARNPAPEPPPSAPQSGPVQPPVAPAPARFPAPPAPARFPAPPAPAPERGPATTGRQDVLGPPPQGPSVPLPPPPVQQEEPRAAAPPVPPAPAPQPPPGHAQGTPPQGVRARGPAPDSHTPPVPGPPQGTPAGGTPAPRPLPPGPVQQPLPGHAQGTPAHGAPTGPPPAAPVPAPQLPRGEGPAEGSGSAALPSGSESADLWNTVIQEINSERGTHPGPVTPVHPRPGPPAAEPPPPSTPPSRRRRFGLGGLLGPRVPEWSALPENFHARMQVPISGHRRVAVLSLKGGVGKTTTSVLLGSLMAAHRESRVVAVDVNRDMGTLRDRIPLQTGLTVRDLYRNAESIRGFTDLRGYVSSNEERMHALVGDHVFGFRELEGEDGYGVVAGVLERYY
ncbi:MULTISPECIES: AAA family ATPase [unclassified Nocardiopsis]|uniref:nucleotide-binding protein n=1 Tax=Nocardiopsis TaxID=2013 RepID=UPI00387A8813